MNHMILICLMTWLVLQLRSIAITVYFQKKINKIKINKNKNKNKNKISCRNLNYTY